MNSGLRRLFRFRDTHIRRATGRDGGGCGAIVNHWIDATDWMPRVHTPEEVVDFFTTKVLANQICWVTLDPTEPIGFIALRPGDALVSALFLAPSARGRGLGKVLLGRAKAECPEGIGLWTFVANTGARRFYEREGFREVARTDGDNDEGLPDILFRWTPEETR